MAEKLNLVPANMLTDVSEVEVNEVIDQIVEKSKDNMEEICELTFECTSLLSSAESKANALSNQGVFKRLIGSVTGKNRKLQSAITENNMNALYASQEVINRVMLECTHNRKLLLAVNDRVSDLYLELKNNQNDIENGLLIVRQAIVSFYKKYQEEILEHDERISRIEEYEKVRCPKCQNELLSWQRVCSYCGYIHPLKVGTESEKTKEVLAQISSLVKDEKLSEDIVWDLTAQKTERVLRKMKTLAEIGELPGYTNEIKSDIENLVNKCKDAEFQIAVVGVMKAGKSFLMNALIGAEIASVEVNPETAALTKFRSANGYHVIVKFHNRTQWEKLKKSAQNSGGGEDSLGARLTNPKTKQMENKWIGHDDIVINCKNLKELQENVKRYTSSQTVEHLFVSEVEVGVDKSIFNMPKEVVFVDTPGLKDPVKYRSNITRKYIKKADAVLIALTPGPLDDQGVEIVTTVLDCTETKKAYIVGTQKDIKNEEDCEKYVSNWVDNLVAAKRYRDKNSVKNRIILTTAKMDLLLNKWYSLSEEERVNGTMNCDDQISLDGYSKKAYKRFDFNIFNMTEENYNFISETTGISTLRNKLENTLISNYRKLKIEDIQRTYERCRNQMIALSKSAISQKEHDIELAISGAEELKKKIDSMNNEKQKLKEEDRLLKDEAKKLEDIVRSKSEKLESKER